MIADLLCRWFGHRRSALGNCRVRWCMRCERVVPWLCLALALCGCRPHAPSSADEVDDRLAEVRLLLAAARPLVEASESLCRESSAPEACATAAREVAASLTDADQLLGAVEACTGDDKVTCQREASRAAAEAGPRLALRLARLAVLVQQRGSK